MRGVLVKIQLRASRNRWPLGRPQRWYWVAVAANGKTVARSSETYTNRGDCLAAAIAITNATVDLAQK